jgi:D-alanyl-D-alanine carboxypeptidase
LLREYEDIIGVKTGFTKKCGRTLVSAAERDGVRLICVTLNDGDDWRDHRVLLDYGFSLYGEVRLAEVGEYTYTLPVCGGVSERVTVKNRESLSRMLPETHGEITSVTELPRFLYAGVCEGDTIGRTVFYADGKKIGEVLLYAEESVGMREEEGFWQKLLSFLLK